MHSYSLPAVKFLPRNRPSISLAIQRTAEMHRATRALRRLRFSSGLLPTGTCSRQRQLRKSSEPRAMRFSARMDRYRQMRRTEAFVQDAEAQCSSSWRQMPLGALCISPTAATWDSCGSQSRDDLFRIDTCAPFGRRCLACDDGRTGPCRTAQTYCGTFI